MAQKSKFPDASKLLATAQAVAEKAKGSGVRAAVVGGYAMQVYGSDRLTTGVDFAADGKLSVGRTSVEVKWIIRTDDYRALYAEVVERSKLTRLAFRVVLPEYLAAMKLAAGRDKDQDDLIWLLRQPNLVDRKAAREIVHRLVGGQFAAESFDAVAREADWRNDSGRSGFRPRRR